MSWVRFGTGATLAAIGGLMARYAIGRERLERSWLTRVDQRLSNIGEVEHLSILPLVERPYRDPPRSPTRWGQERRDEVRVHASLECKEVSK